MAEAAETVLQRFRASAVRRQLAHRKHEKAKGLTRCTVMVPTARHKELLALAKAWRSDHRRKAGADA